MTGACLLDVGGDLLLHAGYQRCRLGGVAGRLADLLDLRVRRVEGGGRGLDQYRNAELLQACDQAARVLRGDDQGRVVLRDRLDVRREAGQAGLRHPGGVIGVLVDGDDPAARADRVQVLGGGRGQRDDPRRVGGDRDRAVAGLDGHGESGGGRARRAAGSRAACRCRAACRWSCCLPMSRSLPGQRRRRRLCPRQPRAVAGFSLRVLPPGGREGRRDRRYAEAAETDHPSHEGRCRLAGRSRPGLDPARAGSSQLRDSAGMASHSARRHRLRSLARRQPAGGRPVGDDRTGWRLVI